jgi:hypothetical protein
MLLINVEVEHQLDIVTADPSHFHPLIEMNCIILLHQQTGTNLGVLAHMVILPKCFIF